MAYPGTFVAGQVLTAAEMNAINEGASARPLLTGGAYIDGTNGLVLSGLSGNYASTPDSAALDLTGDIEVVTKVTVADWTPTGTQTVFGNKRSGGNGYDLALLTNGKIVLSWGPGALNATNGYAESSVATGFADGSTKWLKVTLDVDNGAGGFTVSFQYADDQSSEPSVWTTLGADTVTAAGAAVPTVSADPMDFGRRVVTNDRYLVGTISRVIIRDGIGATVALDADFEAEAADTLAFTEDSSNAATVSVTTTRYTVGIPNTVFTTIASARVVTGNVDNFIPFIVTSPIDVDMYTMEVTTGPASAATVYLGLYEADDDYQPTGAPLNTSSMSVGASATGLFRSQITPVTLKPGAYLLAVNASVSMNVRAMRGVSQFLSHTLGASPFPFDLKRSRTAATFPNPSLAWNQIFMSTSGFDTVVFLRWKAS